MIANLLGTAVLVASLAAEPAGKEVSPAREKTRSAQERPAPEAAASPAKGKPDDSRSPSRPAGQEAKPQEKIKEKPAVRAGRPAPDFVLKDQAGKEVRLSSFRRKANVLVAFYPKDFMAG